MLEQKGENISELISESIKQRQKNIESVINNENQDIEKTGLVEYKPSIWRKISDFIKNKIKYVKDRFGKKEEKEDIEENKSIFDKHEKKEKLHSWDLDNWKVSKKEIENKNFEMLNRINGNNGKKLVDKKVKGEEEK